MSKDILEIVRVAGVVQETLQGMAMEGMVEAAGVSVKNLAWTMDMRRPAGWILTLEGVEETLEERLVRRLIYELELIGLCQDDWDIYPER